MSEAKVKGTCPICGHQARVNDKRRIMVHSAPRSVYKDGRACVGVGRVAVELRK